MVAMLKNPRDLSGTYKLPQPADSQDTNGAERRVFPRKELFTRVQGVRVDNTISAHREPQLSLALRDVSVGGLSAVSPTPLERGERLSVFFPPESGRMGWDAYGRVVRCEPSALGYRVAVEFESLLAA